MVKAWYCFSLEVGMFALQIVIVVDNLFFKFMQICVVFFLISLTYRPSLHFLSCQGCTWHHIAVSGYVTLLPLTISNHTQRRDVLWSVIGEHNVYVYMSWRGSQNTLQ